MQVEIFQYNLTETGNPNLSEIFGNWNRLTQLVRDLNLTGQQNHMDLLEKAKDIPFKLLNREERQIWRHFLVETYTDNAALIDRGVSHGPVSNLIYYDLDLIPLSVLEVWQHCKQMSYFEFYEIWTPNRRPESDPILIGCLGPLIFMIARWGKSFRPFEEIRKEVEWRERRFRPVMDLDE